MKHKELVQQALQALAQANNGKLDPPDVVNEARNPNSPLHKHFEWDDSIAAEKHRLEQARDVIKVYYVPLVVQNNEIVVPYWQSEVEQSTGKRHYASIVDIVSDKDRRYDNAVAAISQARDVLKNCPHPVTQRLAGVLAKQLAALKK